MAEFYICLHFTLDPLDPGRDILIAELENLAVESIAETDHGLDAFIPGADYSEPTMDDFAMTQSVATLSWTVERMEQQNWNATWESQFDPIEVGKQLYIRAPFHASRAGEFTFEIMMEPKMAFGTGHHQTTFMMSEFVLEGEMENKSVLDMGCGTAVLGLLARMRGSSKVVGIDIDEWAVNNALEIVAGNGHPEIQILKGGAELLGSESYDIILANINRNILLADMDKYVRVLNSGGRIYFSGFYETDVPLLEAKGNDLGLSLISKKTKDQWVALEMKKD